MSRPPADLSDDELRLKLLGETSTAPWSSLQRFFARGQVMVAASHLDLIDVAAALATDDAVKVGEWVDAGHLGAATDSQASTWIETDAHLWTVVVKPWVLVAAPEAAR